MTHSSELPLLGLGGCGRGQCGHQSWFPPVLSLGAGQQKAKAPRSASTCPLPARLSHRKCIRQEASWVSKFSISPEPGPVVITNGVHRFKLGTSVGPEATPQKSQGTDTKASSDLPGACGPL